MLRKKIFVGPAALDCNRGDQALIWEAIELVQSICPDCELAMMSEGFGDSQDPQTRQTRRLGVGILPMLIPLPKRSIRQDSKDFIDSRKSVLKMQFRAMWDFLRMCLLLLFARNKRISRCILGLESYHTYEFLYDCKAMVVKGGGFIYAYRGLRWGYFIWYSLFMVLLAQRLGIRVIILPNSFGPFETKWSRWLSRNVLGRCTIVTARESISFDILNAIMPGKARLFPDMAFDLRPDDEKWARDELARFKIPVGSGRCVGVTMRPWRFPKADDPREKYRQYVKSFICLIEHLLKNDYVPVFFAHVVGPNAHEDDRIALKDALEGISRREEIVYVDGDYNCRQVKAFYGLMDFMVCTRFHSAIFSISQNIPCMAVSYQGYKATGIMKDIGLEDYMVSIDHLEEDLLINLFDRLIVEQGQIRQKMRGYMESCTQRLSNLRDQVAAELGREPDR